MTAIAQIYYLVKYYLFSLIKKISFWLCTSIYYVIVIVFNYLLPQWIGITHFELYINYGATLFLMILLVVIIATYNVIYLFKNSLDNGDELLLQSKPYTKQMIIWSKLITIFCLAICYGLIAMFINLFLLCLKIDSTITQAIIIGSFIGTFINYIVWSAIALLFATFCKNIVVFIMVLVVALSMQITSIVLLINNLGSTRKTVYNEHKFELEPIFFYNIEHNNIVKPNLTPYTVVVSGQHTYYFSPINQEHKINDDQTITDVYPDLSTFYNRLYSNTLAQTTDKIKSWFNLSNILFSLYYSLNNKSNKAYNDIDFALDSDYLNYYFYLEFSPFNIVDSNSLNLNQKIYLVTYGKDSEVNITDELYTLSHIASQKNHFFPVYLPSSKDITLQNITTLTEFNKTFFNDDQIKISHFTESLFGRFITNYSSVFASYLITKHKLNLAKMYKDNYYSNILYTWIKNFQFNTFQLINDYFTHINNVNYLKQYYSDITAQTISSWFKIFQLDVSLVPKNIDGFTIYEIPDWKINNKILQWWQMFLFFNNKKLASIYNKILNNYSFTQQELDEIHATRYSYVQKLFLINDSDLVTLNITRAKLYYNNQASISISFLLVAFVVLLLAANVIYKKDII